MLKGRFGAAFDAEFQARVDSVAAGTATGPSAWDGLAAAVAALESGRVVGVDLEDRPTFYGGVA